MSGALRLLVIRHAKSSWSDGSLDDHDRPLNGRGRRDAPAMGRTLARRGWVPEQVFCSDALRTRQTWALMAPSLGEPPVELRPDLYLASPSRMLRVLAERARADTVALVAHCPGVESLVFSLTGFPERMTTCNAALLIGEGTWEDAEWELETVLRPRPVQA